MGSAAGTGSRSPPASPSEAPESVGTTLPAKSVSTHHHDDDDTCWDSDDEGEEGDRWDKDFSINGQRQTLS